MIRLQHSGLLFKGFCMKQAAKALMTRESHYNNPGLMEQLISPMGKLSRKEIRYTSKAVRIDAMDATELMQNLKMPVIALVGEKDYVGAPPGIETIVVKGGHVSPLETPDEVNNLILKIIGLAK